MSLSCFESTQKSNHKPYFGSNIIIELTELFELTQCEYVTINETKFIKIKFAWMAKSSDQFIKITHLLFPFVVKKIWTLISLNKM